MYNEEAQLYSFAFGYPVLAPFIENIVYFQPKCPSTDEGKIRCTTTIQIDLEALCEVRSRKATIARYHLHLESK